MAKHYKKLYASFYSYETFYIDKFEMGADAYCEYEDGTVEKLRVVSILSSSEIDDVSDEFINTQYEEHDHYVVFKINNVKYLVIFDGDYPVDELPRMDELIYC